MATKKRAADKLLSPDERTLIFRNRAIHRGTKLQAYSQDGELEGTFESFPAAITYLKQKEGATAVNPSEHGINGAIKNHTVYHGLRWMALDRELPDNFVQELPPEEQAERSVRSGPVAKLEGESMAQGRVVMVYPCMKDAQRQNANFSHLSSLSKAIQKGSRSKTGHYYVMWSDLDPALREEYEARAEVPAAISRSHSVAVEHVAIGDGDGDAEEVVTRYESINAAAFAHAMSRRKLAEAIALGERILGATWRYAA